jgi:F-type H+-transporting ATPase subunit b
MARGYASQDPKARASAIVEALPGTTLISKTGILATGTAAAIYAVSNSLYVVNAETCLFVVFGAFLYTMSKTAAPAYKDWAEGHINTIKSVLDKARASHVVAVKDRIDSVNQLKNVVSTTKDLFALSKETVELEAKAFELKQQVDMAAEAKSVLDSWVRYESQVRQREQRELAESVIAKIDKEVSTKKFQQQVLQQALVDIDEVFSKKA